MLFDGDPNPNSEKTNRRARLLYGATTPRWGSSYAWLNDEPEHVQEFYSRRPSGFIPTSKPKTNLRDAFDPELAQTDTKSFQKRTVSDIQMDGRSQTGKNNLVPTHPIQSDKQSLLQRALDDQRRISSLENGDDLGQRVTIDQPKSIELAQNSGQGNWDNPAGWALEQAGRTIGTILGVDDTADKEKKQRNETSAEPPLLFERKPSLTTFGESVDLDVDGAFRVEGTAPTAGVDGITYKVFWYPKDANGNIIPVLQADREATGNTLPIIGKDLVGGIEHKPPFPSEFGYRVVIQASTQNARNGNSRGVFMHFTPERDGSLNKAAGSDQSK